MSTLPSTFTSLAGLDVLAGSLRDAMSAWSSRVAARWNPSIVATDISRSEAPPDFLSTYLATVPFTNGDAWEVVR
jgi:hypothetical protein